MKLDDITLYGHVTEVAYKKDDDVFFMLAPFLIMKDLRNQTKIMVTDVVYGPTNAVVFSTHAISRYKERLGLDEDMDFLDVCKHIFTEGKIAAMTMLTHMHLVYGTNTNNRSASITCANGVFMGYYSLETHMHYAKTFLSPNELKEDQAHLDPAKDPH